jgi:hypothetical protein
MVLTEAERTDIRRHCGYPALGGSAAGSVERLYYSQSGLLEYRMSNLSPSEIIIARRYLITLGTLEAAIPRAGENLDTDQASVWTHNKTEVRDRLELFDTWRRRLCEFLGVPGGPGLASRNARLVI